MSLSTLNNEDGHVGSDARYRRTPSLPENSAPFLRLRHSPDSGFGVFASQLIQSGTRILESEDGPAIYVIYRAFRKEVCAWCFRYDQGRNWKIRYEPPSGVQRDSGGGSGGGGSGSAPGPGVVFCREECRDAWKEEYGEVGIEAYAAVEAFVQKQARSRGWSVGISNSNSEEDGDKVPTTSEIEETWKSAEEQASLIRSQRSSSRSPNPNLSSAIKPDRSSKSQKQALAQAIALPILNTDTLSFLLSGVLCASSSSRCPSWRALLTLSPSLHAVYANTDALQQITTTLLHFTAILPLQLLPYVSRETFEVVLARDVANSFGIWSTQEEAQRKLNNSSSDMQEGAEMLGYGTWPIASFFNHSCEPNVARRRIGRRWVFTSAREVSEDEELCISYIRGEENTLNLTERRKRLKHTWGFECRCVKCVHEEENQGVHDE
ncbi:SET6 [Sanghuangporus weigelae]